ncbi:DUF1080 domain-containing protein [Luteolibacter sp. Populi]|uniref:3-keto-disaccharide hydrolase n=1 Tax=Luteolibacter sp. Populi TaxID=3230487 RepID=UPI003466955D
MKLLSLLAFLPLSLLAEEEGFKPLFNGTDLSGWVPCNVAADTFSVKDGMIVTNGMPIGFMRTEKMYENFIIELDWQHMKDAGNSGVFIWGEGLPAPGVPYARGIEVQILDLGYAKNKGANEWFTTHGDIFPIWGATMTPTGKVAKSGVRSFPSKELTLPSPQWNHYRVECNNGEIKLSVNGELVTTGKDSNPKKGFLCLESEGSECHFKNVRIKELPSTGATEAQTARGYEGFAQLFNGKDMGGWKPAAEGAWTSDGVAFRAVPGAQFAGKNLTSEKEYGDFTLCVDWCVKDKTAIEGAGIVLRGLPGALVGIYNGEIGSGAVGGTAPALKADLEIGKWNRFFITVKGKRVTVELNEKVVAKDVELEGLPARGSIVLTHPGTGVEFQNVFLKEEK